MAHRAQSQGAACAWCKAGIGTGASGDRGAYFGSDEQDDTSPRRCPASPAPSLAAGQERLGRAIFSWQLLASEGRLLGLLCLVRQLKGPPVMLLMWLKSHQSCLPAEVWVMGVCKARVPPVDRLASAGGIFNGTKCLHNRVVWYAHFSQKCQTMVSCAGVEECYENCFLVVTAESCFACGSLP